MSFIANGLVTFEEYEIDRVRWQLSWRSEPLPLKRKTFDLLLYLVDHADRVIGKEELLAALWPDSFVEERNLAQHVFLLRKTLSRHESGTKIIETIPGRGYRFAAVIKEQQLPTNLMVISASESIARITLEEVDTSEPASRELEVIQPLLSIPPAKHRLYRIASWSFVAVALCVAGWFGWGYWRNHTGGPPVQVVLTVPEGTTGDPILDVALADAFRIDLAQSPFVTVLSTPRVRATLSQMKLATNAPMTPLTAREVCERTNSQAVLHGTIARMGEHFLITEQAVSCVNGADLGEAKEEASHAEDLPHSFDKLAASLRRALGESRGSIARFDTPLFDQNTVSLEALKDFSQAVHDFVQAKYPEAIQMNDRAIAADPEFATAYFNRAAYDTTVGDDAGSRTAIMKAYTLRDSVSQPIRLGISASYNIDITQNLFETERICRNWSELYPHSPNAWNLFTNAENFSWQDP